MSVFANGRSILHKGHGKTQLAIAPDVCKTPSPGGPVPIPYPNMSPDSNLTKGAETVTIKGNPVATTDSQLSRSNGDEAGTAGGVVSSKNMGAFGWTVGSVDVLAEGKGVVRLLDSILTNGNAYNDTGVNLGEPQLGYGDDAPCPRVDCRLDRVLERHRVPETKALANLCDELVTYVQGLPKRMRGPYGRMVGVGQCKCGTIYKAVSGAEMAGADLANATAAPPAATLRNAVTITDGFTAHLVAANPTWRCAALKIISSAGAHQIVGLSEKWVGNPRPEAKGGGRYPKYVGAVTEFLLPVATLVGVSYVPASRADRVAGQGPGNEIPSGGSIPSCGTCQTFLPAFICEMQPCG